MFQTEIHHYLQSFASDELTAVMRFFTMLGYQEFFLLFLTVLLLAVNYKKAFLLFMVLLWTAGITYFFKVYFDLPRPFHVDNTVELLDGELPGDATFNFSKRGAENFWEGLPNDVLKVTRQSEGVANGFPSGHSSIAITFWGAFLLLFRKRWIKMVAIPLMILVPFSRIYLGVHFLADVLGGIFLGGILLWLFYLIVLKPDRLNHFLQKNKHAIGLNMITLLLLITPLVFFLLLPPKVYILIAFMIGFGLGFLLLARNGLPADEAPISHRIGRTIIAVLIASVVAGLLKIVPTEIGLEENIWIEFFGYLLPALMLMWGGVEAGIRIGWFKRI